MVIGDRSHGGDSNTAVSWRILAERVHPSRYVRHTFAKQVRRTSGRTVITQEQAIVALVTEMLNLQKEQAAAERMLDDKQHRLAKRIEEVDKAIDQAVYQLYGLTEDEVRVVKGK